MASDQTIFHEEQTMKPLCGSEEAKAEPGRSRSKRANGKGPKKQPQRGLGVAQLERLRVEESWKKMNEESGVPSFHDHLLQCHPPMFGSSVPVRYGAAGASSNHVHGGFQCPPQQVINGNTIAMLGQGPFLGNMSGGGGGVCSGINGWLVPNQLNRVGSYGSGTPLWGPLVGSPLETSKELSSMPNVHSEPEFFDVCLKKTRFNEDNVKGSNIRRERPLEIWPNGPDFVGFMPQPSAPNLVGETSNFYNKLARHVAANATPNLDECVGVVAVHRRGNSTSGRVFMEYEFFPGKDGRDTASKELLPTIGSVAVGGEASSITAIAYGDTASNSLDLSLKLSH